MVYYPLYLFINSTHTCYGTNIIGDSDKGRTCKVLLRNSIATFFEIHLSKTKEIERINYKRVEG